MVARLLAAATTAIAAALRDSSGRLARVPTRRRVGLDGRGPRVSRSNCNVGIGSSVARGRRYGAGHSRSYWGGRSGGGLSSSRANKSQNRGKT